ncbi:thiol-activated cytolysin C-terminal domain-containing protein [Bacillus toyonensis]|uniref:thiol-activated cytolysin C-terminal domain-containing protein n=1 Tax=Bacillus toyonensis TaxID=155322 RepID=UPI003F65AA40
MKEYLLLVNIATIGKVIIPAIIRNLHWNKPSYNQNGKEVLTHNNWEGNNQDKMVHYSTVIPLPPNSKNVKVVAGECTGFAWEWWRTIINEQNVPLTNEIKVSIGGTTLYPTANISH